MKFSLSGASLTQLGAIVQVLLQTESHRRHVLEGISQDIFCWFNKMQKTKSVYHAMNLFRSDLGGRCLIGECWCPVDDMEKIQEALQRGTVRLDEVLPTRLKTVFCSS